MKFFRSQKNTEYTTINKTGSGSVLGYRLPLFKSAKQTVAERLLKKIKKNIRHLYQLHVFMLLRYNKILRIFAILLFSFELLAPAVLLSAPEGNLTSANTISHYSDQNQPIDLIAHLIFEEVNNEEREGKDDYLISVCFVEVFNELQKFEPVHVNWSLSKDRFDTQPSLYTLNRVLLI